MPFEPWHLMEIEPQAEQAGIPRWVAAEGFTAIHQGQVLGCAGLIRREPRAMAWAVLADVGPGAFLRIDRAVRRALAEAGPVEMLVREGFEQGQRWAQSLGFTWEWVVNGYDIWVRE